MKRSVFAMVLVLAMAGLGCDRSEPPGVPVEVVHTYCDGLGPTIDYLTRLAREARYDDLYIYWIGGAQSPFSTVSAQFDFCNEALVRDQAGNDERWIDISMEYKQEISIPGVRALTSLRLGDGTQQDRQDILRWLLRSRELVEQILRGGTPADPEAD